MCTDKYTTFSCTHVVREKNFCQAFRAWSKKRRNANFEQCHNYNRVDESSDRKCMRGGKGFCESRMTSDAQGSKKGDKKEEDLIDMGDTMTVDGKDGGALADLNEMVVDKPEKTADQVFDTLLPNVLQKVIGEKVEVGNADPQANLKKSRWA